MNEEITDKEWRDLLDQYLTDGSIDIDMWLRLDNYQKDCIDDIKRSMNRIKNKS